MLKALVSAAVGVDGGTVPSATDRYIDRLRINDVGEERVHMDSNAIACRAPGGMDGPHLARPNMPFGKVRQVDHH